MKPIPDREKIKALLDELGYPPHQPPEGFYQEPKFVFPVGTMFDLSLDDVWRVAREISWPEWAWGYLRFKAATLEYALPDKDEFTPELLEKYLASYPNVAGDLQVIADIDTTINDLQHQKKAILARMKQETDQTFCDDPSLWPHALRAASYNLCPLGCGEMVPTVGHQDKDTVLAAHNLVCKVYKNLNQSPKG